MKAEEPQGRLALEQSVGEMLRQRGETLGVAESCTGGWLGQRITRVPGSSDYFLGGVISYSNTVKHTLLEVPEEELRQHGAVSDPVARSMARGICQAVGSTWGLSITGVAGPGSDNQEKPVGLVYIALAGPDGVQVRELRLGDRSRDDIRWQSTQAALDLLRRELIKQGNSPTNLEETRPASS